MGGSVEIGAVVEGVRGVRRLHAVVALRARVRRDRAALERLDRPLELVALRVVDDVARDEHRLRVLRVRARTAASSVWVENASCGRNVEFNGAPIRSRNGTRAGDSSSRTCVSVSCPNVTSVFPSFAGLPRSTKGSAGPASRNPSPLASTSVPRSVEPGIAGCDWPPHATRASVRRSTARLILRAAPPRRARAGRGGRRARWPARRARAGRR